MTFRREDPPHHPSHLVPMCGERILDETMYRPNMRAIKKTSTAIISNCDSMKVFQCFALFWYSIQFLLSYIQHIKLKKDIYSPFPSLQFLPEIRVM